MAFLLRKSTSCGGDAAGGGSGVWITNVVASGAGNLQVTRHTPLNGEYTSVDSVNTDATNITVSVTWNRGNGSIIQGICSVNGVEVTVLQNAPLTNDTFTGVVTIPVATSIIAAVSGGGVDVVSLTTEIPPVITNFVIVTQLDGLDEFPGNQTEVKAGDTVYVSFESDIPLSSYQFLTSGASALGAYSVPGTDLIFTQVPMIIGSTTTVAALKAAVMRAQSKGAAWSQPFTSDNTINCNNLYPTVVITNIAYPAGQGALKGTEQATVSATVLNFDTVSWSTPASQLSVPNSTLDEPSKVFTRIAGDYNDSVNNVSISATRNANDSTTTTGGIVLIANVIPVITVNEPGNALRSGSNDGTALQSYTITVGSSQRLAMAPDLVEAVGVMPNMSWSSTAKTFSAQLDIADTDVKGSYAWGGMLATGLSGLTTNVITGDDNVRVEGFVSRTLTLPAFANTLTVNTGTFDLAKVTVNWSFDSLQMLRSITDTTPQPQRFFVSTAGTLTTIHLLDVSKTDASSQDTTVTIEETL